MGTELLIAGAVLQTYSQLEKNKAEAKAHRQNAEFFDMQRKQAEAATRRAIDIFEDESEAFIGDQVSSFAKAGVSLEGSALLVVAGTKAAAGRELQAIKKEGETTSTLARMRADNAREQAEYLASDGLAALTVASGAIQATTALAAYNTPWYSSNKASTLAAASTNTLLAPSGSGGASTATYPQLQRPALLRSGI